MNQADRFKFIDDLTILEIINLLTVGITSFPMISQVPSDIPVHGQFIPGENLRMQSYLDDINKWTKNQKMLVNAQKTKSMIFNFTNDYQFTTRLKLEDHQLEVINHTKLLGTIIQDDLKWDLNTQNLIKKANARMQLLRGVASFGASTDDLKKIYILYVRSVLEHSSVVWHSSLSLENAEDLERIQKCAVRIILKDRYTTYQNGLNYLQMDKLSERRKQLCLKFAYKSLENSRLKDLFPVRKKKHEMNTRYQDKYEVQYAKTSRLQNSPVIYMQKLLNENER